MKAVSLGYPMMAVQLDVAGMPMISIANSYPGCPVQPIAGVENIKALRAFCADVLGDPELQVENPPSAINATDLSEASAIFGIAHGDLMELMAWLRVEVKA